MKYLFFGAAVAYGANPIRRVVTLLQDMKKEVVAEGEKEAALYKKFQCYCKTNDGNLDAGAKAAEENIATNTAAAEEKAGLKKQTEEDLKQHKADRKEAQGALAQATALRKKEKAAYDEAAGDTKDYIEATNKAVAALEKGKGGAFLQTNTAAVLKNLLASSNLKNVDASDRMTVTAFLESSKDYIPQSGEIIGILKNMLDEFSASLKGLDTSEAEAVKNFLALKAAKKQEIAAATAAIESKTELKGKLAVEVAQHEAAADTAAKELSDAQEFAANLKTMCADKASDWEERSKKRAEEVSAIDEAITVLNDDDALEVFNKSLKKPEPVSSGSFLQVRTKSSFVNRAKQILKSVKFQSPALSLLAHTAMSKLKQGVDFSKIVVMIDEMVEILKKESASDEKCRDKCEAGLRDSATEKKETENAIESLESEISELEAAIAQNKEVVDKKKEEIAALDKSVEDATAQRKEENEDYKEMVALNTAAVQLLEKAKNKLNKFYNPHMFKAPEERELTEEERLLRGAGQDIGDTTKTTAIDGTTQTTTVFNQAPPPPPETYGEYKTKGGKSNSVIALLDMLVKELQSETQAAEAEEKTAQRDYEALVKDAKASRKSASKAITQTEAEIAGEEESLSVAKDGLVSKSEQLHEIKSQISDLHEQCDFVLAHFEERLAARNTEIEGLKTAKSVLSGADFQ